MHLRMRFIGKALEYMSTRGHDDRRLALQVSPELVHVGDLLRHPLFGSRNVYVVAREVDFIDRCVTVWVDALPGTSLESLHSDADAESHSDADLEELAAEPTLALTASS
jgi:hypothetical protein